MTLQEAYNKGLDDAETAAIAKLTNALQKVDGEPFANPALEVVRQSILEIPPPVTDPPVVIHTDDKEIFDTLELMLHGDNYNYVGTKEKEIILGFYGEMMTFLRTKINMKNKLGVRMKSMLKKVDYELTFERTKVN